MQEKAGEEGSTEPSPDPDAPQPLSEEEVKEKEDLLNSGFKEWSRRDFNSFVRACEKVRQVTSA